MKDDGADRLSLALERIGFLSIQHNGHRRVWGVGSGECIPFFIPDVQYRHGGIQIKGLIGVLTPDFDLYWADLVRMPSSQLSNRNDFLLARYLTNWPECHDPPVFDGAVDTLEAARQVDRWLSSVHRIASRMPRSLQQLDVCCRDDAIDGAPIWQFLGHPVKLRMFALWASRLDLPHIVSTFGRVQLTRLVRTKPCGMPAVQAELDQASQHGRTGRPAKSASRQQSDVRS